MKAQLKMRIFSFLSILSLFFGALGTPAQRTLAASELPTVANGKPQRLRLCKGIRGC